MPPEPRLTMLESFVIMAMFVGFPAACSSALGAYLCGRLLGSSTAAAVGSLLGALLGVTAWLSLLLIVVSEEGWALIGFLIPTFLQIGGGGGLLGGAGATAAKHLDGDDRSTLLVVSGAGAFVASTLIAMYVFRVGMLTGLFH